MKDLNFYKNKASESYAETTFEVLEYIEKLENKLHESISNTSSTKVFFCGEKDEGDQEKQCKNQCDICYLIDRKFAK